MLCKLHLKHVVEQVHCGAAHVDGDGVEEEDGVVLGHTEHHFMVRLSKFKEDIRI